MRFAAIAPVFSIIVILSLGLIGEAKFNFSGVKNSKDEHARPENNRPSDNTRIQSRRYSTEGSGGFEEGTPSKPSAKQSPVKASRSAHRRSNRRQPASYGRSYVHLGYYDQDPNPAAGSNYQDPGVMDAGGMQQAPSIHYGLSQYDLSPKSNTSNFEAAREPNNKMEHLGIGRVGDVPHSGCPNGGGAEVQAMLAAVEAIAVNIDGALQFLQKEADRQSQMQSRMYDYGSRLDTMDKKLDRFLSDHETTSQDVLQATRSADEITSILSQLTYMGESHGQVLNHMGETGMNAEMDDGLDALKESLAKILNKLSAIYNEESVVLNQVMQTVSSIAQNINGLRDPVNPGGGNALTIEGMQSYLEKLMRSIVRAFRLEIASVVQSVSTLNSHISNVSSLSEQLRVSLDSLHNLGTSLAAINQMVVEIKERVFTGCKIHVTGGSGKKFELSQGEKAEIERQEQKRRRESSKNKYAEELAGSWKE